MHLCSLLSGYHAVCLPTQTTLTALQARVALLDQGQIIDADIKLKVQPSTL